MTKPRSTFVLATAGEDEKWAVTLDRAGSAI